jgi:hypothetical protein
VAFDGEERTEVIPGGELTRSIRLEIADAPGSLLLSYQAVDAQE